MATQLQIKVLRGVLNNNFMDGAEGEQKIKHAIWSNCIGDTSEPDMPSGKQLSGIVSTLVQAGYLGSDGECVWLTRYGYSTVTTEADEA